MSINAVAFIANISINTVVFIANIDQIQHFFPKLFMLIFITFCSSFFLVAPRLSDHKVLLVIHEISIIWL